MIGVRVHSRLATVPLARKPLEVPAGIRDLADGRPAVSCSLGWPSRCASEPPPVAVTTMTTWPPPLAATARATLGADGILAQHVAVTHSTLDAVERVSKATAGSRDGG